jgi:hypothetical protein
LQIKTKPGESLVFQSKIGGDVIVELWLETKTLFVYRTIETMMRPSTTAFNEYAGQPYFWSAKTGMMRILKEVVRASYNDVATPEDGERIFNAVEMYVAEL